MPCRVRTGRRPLTIVEEKFEAEVTLSCPAFVNAPVIGSLRSDHYFQTRINVPTIISAAPKIVLSVRTSFKKIADKIIAIATLNLSTDATKETFPI